MADAFSFRPLPMLGNPHVQTLLGYLLQGLAPRLTGRARLLTLPDGDRLVLHDVCPPRWRPGQRGAILVHGLCGSPGREVVIVERGGHLGFVGFDGAGGIRWAERRLADWLVRV